MCLSDTEFGTASSGLLITMIQVIQERLFDKKNPLFKQKSFTDDVKLFFTELMNRQLSERNQMMVFPKNSPFLPTKKIGKNNPKAKQIQETNRLKEEWNKNIWLAYQRGAPRDGLMTVKRELISKPVAESIKASGSKRDPEKYHKILFLAVSILIEMCRTLRKESRETWAEAWGEAIIKLMDYCTEKVIGKPLAQRKNRQRER